MGAEDPGAYGRLIAGRYDRWYGAREVDRLLPGLLARLAVGGAALEVGVGTGRVAGPLHQLGVPVVGIDASPEMLARCRATHPGVLVVALHSVDLASLRGLAPSVVYCTMSTFFQLGDRAVQVATLEAAAACAGRGAALVIDAWRPPEDLGVLPEFSVSHQGDEREVLVTITSHDPSAGQVRHRQVLVEGTDATVIARTDHYLRPDELSELAAEVGWQLESVWSDFEGAPATAGDDWFVMVLRHRSSPDHRSGR